jgi:hypothetical protein
MCIYDEQATANQLDIELNITADFTKQGVSAGLALFGSSTFNIDVSGGGAGGQSINGQLHN